MKIVVLALFIIPAVLSAPDKRQWPFGGTAFDLTSLKNDVQCMIDVIGSDPTEQACELECHNLLTQGHVLNYGCPLLCKSLQTLIQHWHLVPDTTDPSVKTCQLGKK